MDQREFLRQMEELVDFGRTKENLLTKQEIADYCSDWNLTEEQMPFVYAYLKEHRIEVEGYRAPVEKTEEEAVEKSEKDSKYLRLYKEELCQLKRYEEEELVRLLEQLRRGEEEVISSVIEAHLHRVMQLADKYRGRGVPVEDLIQEGNLELTACVAMLCGNEEVVDYQKAIEHAVRKPLIELVDEELAGTDSVHALLGRVNPFAWNWQPRTLAQEYGRIATIEELSEFTHMDIEEINQYVDLSHNEIELGKGENERK